MYEGQKIYRFAEKLFPIYRHLTGEGVRKTLLMIQDYVKEQGICLEIHEIPTGTSVFDWNVPKEWRINKGYIEDSEGNHIIDLNNNNLHIVGYSTPVDEWMDLEELKKHIYTQPEQPYAIPYVTSYYKERWGFCMSEVQKESLPTGNYHAVIESELFDGSLSYGELIIPGELKEEAFFSTYVCHPSMANNECSGPALAAELARYVMALPKRRYTYRFIFIPETIGAISYLATDGHLQYLKTYMKCGYNLTCVGDDRTYSMVGTRYANTFADKVLKNVLAYHCQNGYNQYSFLDRGSDERQYCAPGVDLPVVGFSRSLFCKYPEYHTSDDNLGLVSPAGFQGSFDVMAKVIHCVENNYYYRIKVLCEPQLGKRRLCSTLSQKHNPNRTTKISNFIAYADGENDLVDISNIIGVPVEQLIEIADELCKSDLIEEVCI